MNPTTLSRIGCAVMMVGLAACGGGGGSSPVTGSISGSVTTSVTGAPLAQVSVVLSGAGTATTTTDANGAYRFTSLNPGIYMVTPSLAQATFSPASRSVTVSGTGPSGQDFAAVRSVVIASQIQFLPAAFLSNEQLRASAVTAGDAVFFTDSSDFPLKKVSVSNGAVTPLAGRFSNAESVVPSGQNVFWVDGGTLNESTLDGKTTRAISHGARTAADGGTPQVIVDASNAYWVSDLVSRSCSDCSWVIQRVPLNGGPPVTLATSDRRVVALAADANNLYWEEAMLEPVSPGCNCGSTVHSIPKAGGQKVLIVDGLLNSPPVNPGGGYIQGSWYPAGGIAVTSSALIFAVNGYRVMSVALGGGPLMTLANVTTSSGESLTAIRNISVAGASVYWFDSTNGTVDTVPLTGGVVSTLVGGIALPPANGPMALAVNSTSAYWTEAGAYRGCCLQAGAGTLKQVPLVGGVPTVVASGLDAPTAVAVDDTDIVWTEAWRIATTQVKGGVSTTVASGLSSNMARITTDATNVYILDGDFIKTLPVAGGAVGKLAAARGGSIGDQSVQNQDLVTGGGSLYWTIFGVPTPPVVQKVATTGGIPIVLSAEATFVQTQECDWRILLAGDTVYWSAGSAQPTPVGCSIKKVPAAGGTTTTIIDVPFMRDFTVDSSSIYFSQVKAPIPTLQQIPLDGGTPTTVVSNVVAWVLTGDANRLYWMDAFSNTIGGVSKVPASATPFTLPVALTSDPMLAAEAVTIAADGLYATSTGSGEIFRFY
jgi:hypothetical protein